MTINDLLTKIEELIGDGALKLKLDSNVIIKNLGADWTTTDIITVYEQADELVIEVSGAPAELA